MYIDAIIVIALIILSFGWHRKFPKTVYAVASIDILMRLAHALTRKLGVKKFTKFIVNVFPESIPALADKYTGGIVYTIIYWAYLIIMCCFLGFTIRGAIKKGRI